MAGNRPVKFFKAGAIKASIFENTNKYNGIETTTHKVVIDKVYKDSDGNWKSTNSFSVNNELPKAILVLTKAFEFLAMNENKENGNISRSEN